MPPRRSGRSGRRRRRPGDPDTAGREAAEGATILEQIGDAWGQVQAQALNLGRLRRSTGDTEAAVARFDADEVRRELIRPPSRRPAR